MSRAQDTSRLAADALLQHLAPDAALLDSRLEVQRFLGQGKRYFNLQEDQPSISAPALLSEPFRFELMRLFGRHAQSRQPENGLAIESVADRRRVTLTLYPAADGFFLLVFTPSALLDGPIAIATANDEEPRAGQQLAPTVEVVDESMPVKEEGPQTINHAERRDLEALRSLQAALDLAPDPVAIKRVDGTYSYANAQYLYCFGLDRDIRGEAEADLLPQSLSQDLSALNAEALAGRQAVRREVHWQQEDRSHYSLCVVFALFDAENRVYATVSVFTDVTYLRNAREELRQQAQKLQQIIDGISDAVVVLDRDGKIEHVNETWGQLACEGVSHNLGGWNVGDSYLESFLSSSNSVNRSLSDMLSKPQPFELEYPCNRQSECRQYLLRSTPLPTGGAVLLHIDITARYREELNRRMTEAVFENANDIILICRPCGEVVMANPQAVIVFGRCELAGTRLTSLFSKRFLVTQGRKVRQLLRRGDSWRGEAQALVSDGRVIPLWGSAAVVRSEQSTDSYLIVVASNIVPLKEAQERLSYQAFYDDLTGLPNRRFFRESLTAATHRANRHGQGLSLIFIDLDRFKLINDTHGHDVGDAFLTEVAHRLRSHVREVDLVSRMGGDEFTVILEGVQREHDIAGVCQKLIDALKPVIKVGDVELFAECSMGISCFPQDARDEVCLLRCADLAMYQAKQNGRNQFFFYALC